VLTFAAKSMEHTANQLQQWAKEPDLGVKSFANSILLTSRSICIPYQGVLLDRMSNPREGFVFRAKSCSGNFSNRKRCSHCASKINVANKVRESFESIDKCAWKQGKQATVTNISRNPVLAATEICMAREEIICEQWNKVVDICNGRHGPHSPDNPVMQQTRLLDTLVWFSRWKELHDERVRVKPTEYNFFANKTWFCINSLLLAHITVIQLYSVMKGESISPGSMNTDTVECFLEMPDRWWVAAPTS
jgi:hypothetical protein